MIFIQPLSCAGWPRLGFHKHKKVGGETWREDTGAKNTENYKRVRRLLIESSSSASSSIWTTSA